jgi:hypothetical protein
VVSDEQDFIVVEAAVGTDLYEPLLRGEQVDVQLPERGWHMFWRNAEGG